jgi:hypothetical protein
VRLEHVGVRRVDHRGLGRLVEERARVADEVLVERVLLRHEDRERRGTAPTRATRLLPHRGARPGVADEDRGVERTDVDAELERVRRRDRDEVPVGQLAFQFAPVLGEVARAVGLDARSEVGRDLAAREVGEQFRRAPRAGEADRPDALVGQSADEGGRLRQRAPPRAGLVVDDRRVPQREELLPARRGVLGHGLEGSSPGFPIVAEARTKRGSPP